MSFKINATHALQDFTEATTHRESLQQTCTITRESQYTNNTNCSPGTASVRRSEGHDEAVPRTGALPAGPWLAAVALTRESSGGTSWLGLTD